ncbi:MAG: VWA domain-containing protein, partial [Desulfuromonadales bacterium]|nr:VWA domain-containing protein [Desulfuromonadales bacterium]
VVLLVMLLNGDMVATRREIVTDLRSEVMRLERQVKVGTEHLVSLQNSMVQTETEVVRTEGLSEQVIANIEQTKLELATMSGKSQAARKHINALQSDLLSLDKENQRIGAQQQTELAKGTQTREFIGQGDRQYLTGLRLGGKRVLLLVDASASMLDETIVNVIVRRNLDDRTKRAAPKWKRAIRTVEWLTANLPADSSLQIYTFNSKANPVVADLKGNWVATSDYKNINRMIAALKQTVPKGGTSLYNVFTAAARMKPRPDNILLLTDGLPTQGKNKSSKNTISGDERLKLFLHATSALPRSVPVNTILFPMEGDPMAAVSFWQLAIKTGGSFLTPTRDWP